MTQAETWFQCCHCKRDLPIGELAVPFSADASAGRGYCIVCYTNLSGNEPPRMSRALANQVSATLNQIDTDFFTRQG